MKKSYAFPHGRASPPPKKYFSSVAGNDRTILPGGMRGRDFLTGPRYTSVA